MILEHEREVALKVARRAGEMALHYFAQEFDDEQKDDFSPVTIADKECEKLITQLLSDAFPADGIIGEEGAFKPSRSGRRWIIDPIDGTRDFVRRTPFWAIQLALEAEGEVVLGLVYLPCFDEMFHAAAGAGCFWNDRLTHVSAIDRLDKAIVMISGFTSLWKKMPADQIRFLTENCWTMRSYSGCYDVTMIARGKADIWVSGSGMIWDYAPARVIAQECGAVFFNMAGNDRIDANNCIVCSRGLESELRQILGIPY